MCSTLDSWFWDMCSLKCGRHEVSKRVWAAAQSHGSLVCADSETGSVHETTGGLQTHMKTGWVLFQWRWCCVLTVWRQTAPSKNFRKIICMKFKQVPFLPHQLCWKLQVWDAELQRILLAGGRVCFCVSPWLHKCFVPNRLHFKSKLASVSLC